MSGIKAGFDLSALGDDDDGMIEELPEWMVKVDATDAEMLE